MVELTALSSRKGTAIATF